MQPPPFSEYLGVSFTRRDGDGAEAVMEIAPNHLNRSGVVHGGVISGLLDVTLGAAVIAAIPPEWWCATLSLSVQYLDGVRKGTLTATAEVTRRGAGIAHARGEIRDHRGRTVATAEGSWHLRTHKPGEPRPPRTPHVLLRSTGERIPVGKIVCAGRNYAAHIDEMKAPRKGGPVLFFKPSSAIVHGGGSVVLPRGAGEVHHEVELVVVIGRPGKAIPKSEAQDHVLGYAVGLDMTLRDLQQAAKKGGKPWGVSKGFDTSAPVSPVTPINEVGDGFGLAITLDVNGERRQESSTSMMLHDVASLVSLASQLNTLDRGDLIFTGTPAGVGPVSAGDLLEAEIEKVGKLKINVVDED
jgi:uncharacterized protein (TIGR00369 family)